MQHPHTRCSPRVGKPCFSGKVGPRTDRGHPLTLGPLILGAVIAGGRALRFGSDKAVALFEGRPLIDHAIDSLGGHVDHVIVVGREWKCETIADMPGENLGPLGGIAAALDYALANGYESVLTIGCDMPHTPNGLLKALLDHAPGYCPEAPILGHWPGALAPSLIKRLAGDGDRSVRRWANEIDARTVSASAPLANVNTQADLAAL